MSVMYIRDKDGVFQPIKTIRGAPGYTPQRGKDYWTEDDRQQIVGDVLTQMPETGGGTGNSGAWSLIINQRIAEDCVSVAFDTGDNGETLSEYDDIIIFVDLCANAGDYTSGVRISFAKTHTPWTGGYATRISGKKLSEFTGRNMHAVRFEKTGVGVLPTVEWNQLNETNVAKTLYLSSGTGAGNHVNFDTPFAVDGPDALEYATISMAAEFETIRIGGYQAVMGAGTVIKIWGHKA